MSIIYIDSSPKDSFYERQLPNGVYRYEGYFHTVSYCIDAKIQRTKEQIEEFLNRCSVGFLVDKEGYIISIN